MYKTDELEKFKIALMNCHSAASMLIHEDCTPQQFEATLGVVTYWTTYWEAKSTTGNIYIQRQEVKNAERKNKSVS